MMRNLDEKVTQNFTYRELVRSETAEKLGIDNTPESEEEWEALEKLAKEVLQPARDALGAIRINSCYRGKKLNEAVGGSANSNHCKAIAADLDALECSNYELFMWIYNNVPFYELIAEKIDRDDPKSGWVHVAYNGTRREAGLKILENKKGAKVRLASIEEIQNLFHA